MRSVTASYWIPLQVEQPQGDLQRFTGFGERSHDPVDDLMDRVIDNMTYIHGNIAGAYYVVERITKGEDENCCFHLEVVITGIVSGDADADDYIHDEWPTDLVEQFKVEWEEGKPDELLGYDLNPLQSSPSMTTFNGTW